MSATTVTPPAAWDALVAEARALTVYPVITNGKIEMTVRNVVITDIPTGVQQVWGLWERPAGADEAWEIDEAEVTASLEDLIRVMQVWKVYADPPESLAATVRRL